MNKYNIRGALATAALAIGSFFNGCSNDATDAEPQMVDVPVFDSSSSSEVEVSSSSEISLNYLQMDTLWALATNPYENSSNKNNFLQLSKVGLNMYPGEYVNEYNELSMESQYIYLESLKDSVLDVIVKKIEAGLEEFNEQELPGAKWVVNRDALSYGVEGGYYGGGVTGSGSFIDYSPESDEWWSSNIMDIAAMMRVALDQHTNEYHSFREWVRNYYSPVSGIKPWNNLKNSECPGGGKFQKVTGSIEKVDVHVYFISDEKTPGIWHELLSGVDDWSSNEEKDSAVVKYVYDVLMPNYPQIPLGTKYTGAKSRLVLPRAFIAQDGVGRVNAEAYITNLDEFPEARDESTAGHLIGMKVQFDGCAGGVPAYLSDMGGSIIENNNYNYYSGVEILGNNAEPQNKIRKVAGGIGR